MWGGWCWVSSRSGWLLELLTELIINNDDKDIDWEVEQDQEVCHGLEAHHPERRDVLVELLNATHLLLWERLFQ